MRFAISMILHGVPRVSSLSSVGIDSNWLGDNTIGAKTEGVKVSTDADGKKIAEINLPSTSPADVEAGYAAVMEQLKRQALQPKQQSSGRDASTKQDDYFRQFRTNVVIFWFLSNAVLIYVITKDVVADALFGRRSTNGVNPYLTFLFWSIAALSVFRFLFSTLYLFQHFQDKSVGCCIGRRH